MPNDEEILEVEVDDDEEMYDMLPEETYEGTDVLVIEDTDPYIPPLSLVKLSQWYRDYMGEYMESEHWHGDKSKWGDGYYTEFLAQDKFIYLGEIPNMPGHCVIVGMNGRTYFGFHTDDFQELDENET